MYWLGLRSLRNALESSVLDDDEDSESLEDSERRRGFLPD